MRRRNRWLAFAVAVVSAAAAVSQLGASKAVRDEAVARGSISYRVYCSNCHGRTGKGDGKLASELRHPPADLTQLASDNGGVFDADAVSEYIDGRKDVTAHGEREMPVWGVAFQHTNEGGDQEAVARGKIDELVAFLETLQAPAKK